MGSSCSNLALLARSKLGQVAVVITFHLVIENFGLSGLGLWDQRLIQDIKNILAHFLEFGLDLLTVITDGRNVLVGTLRLFLLLDRGDYAPGSTSSANNILVGDGQKVSLVNCELST
jgi:hypothetical protein